MRILYLKRLRLCFQIQSFGKGLLLKKGKDFRLKIYASICTLKRQIILRRERWLTCSVRMRWKWWELSVLVAFQLTILRLFLWVRGCVCYVAITIILSFLFNRFWPPKWTWKLKPRWLNTSIRYVRWHMIKISSPGRKIRTSRDRRSTLLALFLHK